MTLLEAIKSVTSYPVPDNTANMILVKRGLSGTSTLDATTVNSKAFELATADIYMWLVSGTNISEGGYSISITDKSNLMKLASGIYAKHGETMPGNPTITNASDRW